MAQDISQACNSWFVNIPKSITKLEENFKILREKNHEMNVLYILYKNTLGCYQSDPKAEETCAFAALQNKWQEVCDAFICIINHNLPLEIETNDDILYLSCYLSLMEEDIVRQIKEVSKALQCWSGKNFFEEKSQIKEMNYRWRSHVNWDKFCIKSSRNCCCGH